MRLLNFILIIFLILTNGIKADTEFQVLKNLKNGGNLIFIRHAYAPGGGDPDNFDIHDCSTQRNLSMEGKEQAKNIGDYFKNKIELKPIILFNFAILFQVILGIVTLITGVKIYYASLHQLGSVFVLSSFIFIYYKNTN